MSVRAMKPNAALRDLRRQVLSHFCTYILRLAKVLLAMLAQLHLGHVGRSFAGREVSDTAS